MGIAHNLPERTPHFWGSTSLLDDLRRRLTHGHQQRIIPIEGPGGLGKTALALEIAWRLNEGFLSPEDGFDAIVWAATRSPALVAPAPSLSIDQCRPDPVPHRLESICGVVLGVLGHPAGNVARSAMGAREACAAVGAALCAAGRVLLIIDELDCADPAHVPLIRRLLESLPDEDKAIVTLRQGQDLQFPIQPPAFGDDEMDAFIASECARDGVAITPALRRRIHEIAMGMPLAARAAMCHAHLLGPGATAGDLDAFRDHLAAYVCGAALAHLRAEHHASYDALAILARRDLRGGLRGAARALGLDLDSAAALLRPLRDANLVMPDLGHGGYAILPITRWYLARAT